MTTISLKLPDHLLREIEAAAASRGLPKSVIIRESLERTLQAGSRAKRRASCLDLVRDLVGYFEGPPDLSTNPKYLRDTLLADHERRRKNPR